MVASTATKARVIDFIFRTFKTPPGRKQVQRLKLRSESSAVKSMTSLGAKRDAKRSLGALASASGFKLKF